MRLYTWIWHVDGLKGKALGKIGL